MNPKTQAVIFAARQVLQRARSNRKVILNEASTGLALLAVLGFIFTR